MKALQVENLKIKIYSSRKHTGECAAVDVVETVTCLLEKEKEINIVFAAALSQNEFLEAVTKSRNSGWSKVNAFHLDEYISLGKKSQNRFGNFLKNKIFDKLNFKNVYYLNDDNDPEKECERYSHLIKTHPLDIACIGIGENGHIAFNDPSNADFKDKKLVKVVELDNKSRVQQVRDKCFKSLAQVPQKAITMTIPAILSAKYIYCIVPGSFKAEAVKNAVTGPISETCPASILRKHDNSIL